MEEPKKRKIHGTEIILPKQLLNLNLSGRCQFAAKQCKTKQSKCTQGRCQFTAKRQKSQDSNNQKSNHENGNENER
jgi:hypothetical protein